MIARDGVHFDFDKSTLKPEGMAVLNQAAALLQKHERVVVEVAGHTDSMGSEEYNQGLSERRATAVKEYMVSEGIDAGIIDASGEGESNPVADNRHYDGRALNRRFDVHVGAKQQLK